MDCAFVFVYSASGGELQMLLDKDEVPEERQVKRLMRQILDGLVYLHSINVAHLDIKVRYCFNPLHAMSRLDRLCVLALKSP
jgi:serine/threonine protein kinase